MFDELPSKGLQPDVISYNTLIGALCKQGKIDEAKDLMTQMVSNGCLPDSVTYNVFLHGLLKWNEMHDAIPILEEMNSREFKLCATTFSMLIEPLERGGRNSVLFEKVKKLVPKDLVFS